MFASNGGKIMQMGIALADSRMYCNILWYDTVYAHTNTFDDVHINEPLYA